MVSIAPRPLSKLGFRRDVKLFLAVLVSFFAILIVALLILLSEQVERSKEAVRLRWESVARLMADQLVEVPVESRSALELRASALVRRYDAAFVEVSTAQFNTVVGTKKGDLVILEKRGLFGSLRVGFDALPVRKLDQTFRLTSAIFIAAAFGGVVLLLLFLPRVVRPIEEMLDHAAGAGLQPSEAQGDETQYLIETFKQSIETLRAQEQELKRLHELERTRADELERIASTLTRSLSSGFIALDASGRVVELNRSGREILEIPNDRDISGLSADVFDAPLAETLQRAFDEREALVRQEVELSRGATTLSIGLTTVPLLNEQDEVLGMLALFTDLTPLRTLESRVREMQTLADLGEISAGIAHEFRNSLSTILGYLKLARKKSLPADAEERIRFAEEESRLLADAVEGLLSFARPMRLDVQTVELQSLLRRIGERLVAAAEDITVQLEVTGEEAELRADAGVLSRAFENLVRNSIDAIRAAGRSGTVTIETRAVPHPVVRIADDGVGIDPGKIARIFLPFQSDKPTGIGMGLPLTRKIIVLHGGAISIAPRPEGGTVVTVEFLDPMALQAERHEAAQSVTI